MSVKSKVSELSDEKFNQQYYILRGISESADGPVFSLDTKYCYTSFNNSHKGTMKLLYGADIMPGKCMLDYQTSDKDREKAKTNIDRTLKGEYVTESAWSGEDVTTRRFFEVSHNPVFNDNDEVIGVVVRARDLTESKLAEEKLHESEDLFLKLFDNMLNGFALCKMLYVADGKPDFIYLKVNNAFETQTGLKNVAGKKASEVIPGIQESDPGLLEQFGRVALTGKPEEFEFYVESLKMWCLISVYSPQKEYFVAVFDVITKRKQTEEYLRESNEYLSNLINYANAPIIVWDTSLLITQFNHAFERLSGYFEEEVLGKKIDMLFSKEKTKFSIDLINRAVSGERWETIEIEIQRKDGDSRTILWNSANNLDKDGKTVVSTIAQGYDITDRKKAEEESQKSELKFRETVKYLDEGYYSVTPEGLLLEHNQAFIRILGFEPTSDMKGVKLPDFWQNPDDRKIYLEELITKGFIRNFQINAKKLNGEKVVVIANSHMVKDEKGGLVRIEGTFTDFTELKLMEAALKENESKYRSLFENAQVGIYRSKLDGSALLAVNRRLCEIFGYTEEEMLGNPATIRWADPGARERMIENLRKNGFLHDYEMNILTKKGEIRSLSISVNLYPEQGFLEGSGIDITERKKAEKSLKESEERFRGVFDSNMLGTLFWDANGDIVAANDAFLEIVGYSREDLISGTLKWKKLTPAKYNTIDEEKLKELASRGKIDPFEKEYIHKSGRIIPIIISAATLSGSKISGVAVILDLSDRKKAEEALRLKNLVFDASIAANSISDINGIITEANNAFLHIWGYTSKSEVIGKPLTNFINSTDEAVAIVSSLNTSGEWEGDYIARRKDGSTFIAHGLATVVKNEDGKVIGYQSAVLDITARKYAEEKLFSLATRQEAILSAIPDIIMEVDTNKEYTWANNSGIEFFGNDVIGKRADFYFEGEQDTYKNVQPLFDGSNDIIYLESWQRRKDGEIRLLAWWCRVLKDENGIVSGTLSSALDITEQKIAESQIRKLNEDLELRVYERTAQLETANKELEAFTYSVSHDLRAPLRAVHGYTKILLDEYESKLDDEGKRLFRIVYSSASQMGELIDDLLSFSRIGKSSMNYSILNMKSLAETVFADFTSGKDKIKINLKTGKLHKAYGDATLIRQVWTNLISNALKYSSKKEVSEISIGSSFRDNMIIYYVKDNGVGFDMLYKHKLFGVFQRLHTEKEFEGNGVGLAIVQRIINRHGGKVWAEGEVDKGATFYFSLPGTGHRAPSIKLIDKPIK